MAFWVLSGTLAQHDSNGRMKPWAASHGRTKGGQREAQGVTETQGEKQDKGNHKRHKHKTRQKHKTRHDGNGMIEGQTTTQQTWWKARVSLSLSPSLSLFLSLSLARGLATAGGPGGARPGGIGFLLRLRWSQATWFLFRGVRNRLECKGLWDSERNTEGHSGLQWMLEDHKWS